MRKLLLLAVFYAIKSSAAPTDWEEWLNQDVRWLIGPNEKQQFLALTNDADRNHFESAFWKRRDPTPDTSFNEARETHKRRLREANALFSARKRGCLTDRGHVYVLYGAPDRIGSNGGLLWHYNFIDGLGRDIDVRFVYDKHDRDLRVALDDDVKAALFYQPDLIDLGSTAIRQ